MSKDAKDNYDEENGDDPRAEAVGNTEPAEPSETDPGQPGKKGKVAEAPDGAEEEEYPGPSGDPEEIEEGGGEAK